MAPVRRYLRISKYSVLECRIFLENPADGPRWLLNPQDPALPRVFEAIRPLVLPKLREENDRIKEKGKKKKTVKDVVSRDDFEVAIFLTEIGTRHSLLAKSKVFDDVGPSVDEARASAGLGNEPVVIQEDSDDEINLASLNSIPLHQNAADLPEGSRLRRPSRGSSRRLEGEPPEDNKKKLAFKTSFEGFSIWGWVLCLLVERKGGPGQKKNAGSDGQALMAEWITSTQQMQEE